MILSTKFLYFLLYIRAGFVKQLLRSRPSLGWLALGEWVGTRITEFFGIHFFVRVLIFIGNVEVLSQSSSMMRADKVFNDFRQIMFLGKLQAICDMAYDNLRTLFIVEAFMRIYSRLVLGEEGGVYHFTYIMVKRSCTNQLAFCTDLLAASAARLAI